MDMDPKLLYWTVAFGNLTVALACALAGWRKIRQGELATHRVLMKASAVLVIAFLVSYLFKLMLLGREELGEWNPASVVVLRVHETFMLIMVLAGSTALILSRRVARDRRPGLDGVAVASDLARVRRLHRWAGRTALGAAILGLATAIPVLSGMYARAHQPGPSDHASDAREVSSQAPSSSQE